MTTVALTEDDLTYANAVAQEIYAESRRQGLYAGGATGSYSRRNEVTGVLGEIAAARYLGIKFEPNINQFKKPDVANLQVRTTRYPNGKLIIRKRDPIDDPYLLVVIPKKDVAIMAGWINGKDAMIQENWHNKEKIKKLLGPGDAAWVLFQDQLKPMTELEIQNCHT